MATKLKSYNFPPQSKLTNGDKAVYPWDDWFDGDIWQIEAGEDFDGHPLMMERIIRTRATNRSAKIKMRHLPKDGEPWGVIILQRTDVEGPDSAKRRETTEKRAATRAAKVSPSTVTKKPAVGKAPAVKKLTSKTNGTPTKKPSKRLASV